MVRDRLDDTYDPSLAPMPEDAVTAAAAAPPPRRRSNAKNAKAPQQPSAPPEDRDRPLQFAKAQLRQLAHTAKAAVDDSSAAVHARAPLMWDELRRRAAAGAAAALKRPGGQLRSGPGVGVPAMAPTFHVSPVGG
jgi:hypothetical protein